MPAPPPDRDIQIVLGANYGDEGKGHVLEALSGPGDTNVRYYGGPQAGQAVVLDGGRQVVLKQWGPGSSAGARTLFTHRTAVDPLELEHEAAVLAAEGLTPPSALLDPRCLLITPFDRAVAALTAGSGRSAGHGSGLEECRQRSLDPGLRLTAADLEYRDRVADKLQAIQSRWVPSALFSAGVTQTDPRLKEFLGSDLSATFLDAIDRWRRLFTLSNDESALKQAAGQGRLQFCGSGGLLMGPDHPDALAELQSWLGGPLAGRPVRLHLVSRVYFCRHGEGPLLNGLQPQPSPGIADPSNPENPFQGKMRYAPLELDWMDYVWTDTSARLAQMGVTGEVGFDFTCLDHMEGWNRSHPFEGWFIFTQTSRTGPAVRVGPISRLLDGRQVWQVSDGRTRHDFFHPDGLYPVK